MPLELRQAPGAQKPAAKGLGKTKGAGVYDTRPFFMFRWNEG